MKKHSAPKLYVGCGLTYAPEEFRRGVETTKQYLSSTNWEVMRFLGLAGGTAGDVYDQDIEENIRSCSAFLAVVDHPATGLGWELGVADERKTPTLIVAGVNCKVTRLVEGAAKRNSHITFKRYESMSQIPALVETYLRPMIK